MRAWHLYGVGSNLKPSLLLSLSYDEKLKELKENAAIKAVEAGIEKKEISREIDRIQRNMQHQFHMEFNTLLQKIELKGENKRFQRYYFHRIIIILTNLTSFFF